MKLWVTTYELYNRGILRGKWMNLADFPDAAAFEKACRKSFPPSAGEELMFPDCETSEDWEEGLYSESAIPREWWKLKAEADAAAAAAKKPRKVSPDAAEQERLLARYVGEWGAVWGAGSSDDRRKNVARIVELSDGGLVAIDKPAIETRFCFGEDDRGQGGDGPGTMAYAMKQCREVETKAGFLRANLGDFDRNAGRYAPAPGRSLFSAKASWKFADDSPARVVYNLEDGDSYDYGKRFPLSEEDCRRLADGFAKVRAAFVKRLETWWKRYGASKITTWTYWTEA